MKWIFTDLRFQELSTLQNLISAKKLCFCGLIYFFHCEWFNSIKNYGCFLLRTFSIHPTQGRFYSKWRCRNINSRLEDEEKVNRMKQVDDNFNFLARVVFLNRIKRDAFLRKKVSNNYLYFEKVTFSTRPQYVGVSGQWGFLDFLTNLEWILYFCFPVARHKFFFSQPASQCESNMAANEKVFVKFKCETRLWNVFEDEIRS